MVDDFKLAFDNADQRDIEGAAAEVVHNPLAITQIFSLSFVSKSEASRYWLLKQENLFEPSLNSRFFSGIGLDGVE